MHAARLARVALPILVVAAALILVASGGARSTRLAAVADCPGPSAIDIAHSDPFWYWPCSAFLHVEIDPADASMGSVRSDPYYIDCPSACTRPYAPGARTTLWATPSSGTTFTGWSGAACEGQGNPCIATVVGDATVTANFTGTVVPLAPAPPLGPPPGPSLVTLHVFMGDTFQQAGDSVTGTNGFSCAQFQFNCFQTYPAGSVVTLTSSSACATTWTDTAAGGPFANPHTFTITSSRSVNPHVVCPG